MFFHVIDRNVLLFMQFGSYSVAEDEFSNG